MKFKIRLVQRVADGLWYWELQDQRGEITIQKSSGGFSMEADARNDVEDAARYLSVTGTGKTVTYDYEVPR